MPYDLARMTTENDQQLDQKLRAGTLNSCIAAGINNARIRFMPPLIPHPALIFLAFLFNLLLITRRDDLALKALNSSTPFDTYKILHRILKKSTGELNSRGYHILTHFTTASASNDTEAKAMVKNFTATVAKKFKLLIIEKHYDENRDLLEPAQLLLENAEHITPATIKKIENFFNQLQQEIAMPLLKLTAFDSDAARAIVNLYNAWNNYYFLHGIETTNKGMQKKYYTRLSPEDRQEADTVIAAHHLGELLSRRGTEFNSDTDLAVIRSGLFAQSTLSRFGGRSELEEQLLTNADSSLLR